MKKSSFQKGTLNKPGHSGTMRHKGKGTRSLIATPSNAASLGGKSGSFKKA